jgi:hypothetical protein
MSRYRIDLDNLKGQAMSLPLLLLRSRSAGPTRRGPTITELEAKLKEARAVQKKECEDVPPAGQKKKLIEIMTGHETEQ